MKKLFFLSLSLLAISPLNVLAIWPFGKNKGSEEAQEIPKIKSPEELDLEAIKVTIGTVSAEGLDYIHFHTKRCRKNRFLRQPGELKCPEDAIDFVREIEEDNRISHEAATSFERILKKGDVGLAQVEALCQAEKARLKDLKKAQREALIKEKRSTSK